MQEWYQEVSRSRNVTSSDISQSQTWILLEVLGAPDMLEENRDVLGYVDGNEMLHSDCHTQAMTKYMTASSQDL